MQRHDPVLPCAAMQRSDFHYNLPQDLVATRPCDARTGSRLLYLRFLGPARRRDVRQLDIDPAARQRAGLDPGAGRVDGAGRGLDGDRQLVSWGGTYLQRS